MTEGRAAFDDAISDLSPGGNYSNPVSTLQYSADLANACKDHVSDTGPCGVFSHTGTDGSTPTTRIAKYCTTSSLGENLAASNYNSTDGTRVIIQLIVDDGVPDRGHRANLYSSIYTHSGVSCGCDIKYEVQCCLDYAKNPVSLSTNTTTEDPEQIKRNEDDAILPDIHSHSSYQGFGQGILASINKARGDPASFVSLIQDQYDSFSDNNTFIDGNKTFKAYTSKTTWMDAINFLNNQGSVSLLSWSESLSKVCRLFVNDVGPCGLTSSTYYNGSSFDSAYNFWITSKGSTYVNLGYQLYTTNLSNTNSSDDFVRVMLVSDNASNDTTSRMNVFSTNFTSMGSACSCHSNTSISTVCCAAFSTELEIKASDHKTPLWFQMKTPQECNATCGQTIYEEDDPLYNCLYTYQYSSINTSNPLTYLQLSQVIFDEINAARMCPLVIKETIDADIASFNSSNNQQLCVGNQTCKVYTEGKSAFVEASNYLSNKSAISSLIWSDSLANACLDLLRANSGCGETGHTGLDSSTILSRMKQYFYYDGAYNVNENLSYDPIDGKDAVAAFIVDDGVPNRTNRTNLFNSNFTHLGVACGCTNHNTYKTMCCAEFSAGQTNKIGVTAEAISTNIVGSERCANCSVSIYKKPT